MWLRKTKKRKKLKSLIRFHSANKIDSYNRDGGEKRKNPEEPAEQVKRENNTRFSWVAAARVLSLAGRRSPPRLPGMPSDTMLIPGPAAGAAQILICSCSSVFLLPMSTAIN